MKKELKAVKKYKFLAFLTIAISLFAACEDDFSDVGSDLVNNNNFNSLLYDSSNLNAYSVKINGAQTNNFNNLLLGVYNDPVYGKMTANVVSQLSLGTTNPDFGIDPVIDSVVLSIPYYSTAVDIDDDATIYELDSVYGNGPIDLSIYRNNYYISSLDPNNDYEAQEYYTNQYNTFDQNHSSLALLEISNYTPSAQETVLIELNEDESDDTEQVFDTVRSTPSFRYHLDTEDFQEIIFDREGSSDLISNANFQNYFRGLYFKSESLSDTGTMSLLNFSNASITIYYTYSYETTQENNDGTETTVIEEDKDEFSLSFSTNFNVYENEYENVPDQEKLYLKGGSGSMAVIDLFTDQNQLDSIRELGWLVNEANLTFYVDETQVDLEDTITQPSRLFIYDINNNTVLSDYSFDISANDNNPFLSRLIHLGNLSGDNNRRYYKLRVTSLVNNIINNDSTNTKLGLTVSANVNQTNTTKGIFTNAPEELENIPVGHVLTPEGTVLYGTEENSDKKLKLEIYYTEPN
ncbi:DUF4270 domain-containing protein [Mesonia sp.]|uniref:DUF4270 domain-containing protein n=1 Tax=Mesonia sp. TaxID=1960830 RepID=UPI0025BC46E0|nr:DUF4270 domain-containing protein [Mesonia sp.]